MAGKRDISWVADTLIAFLQDNLPAKLNELDAEYNDGIVLEDIPNEFMFVSEKLNPPGYPMLVIIAEGTDLNPFDGQSRYGIEHHELTIAIALISRGEDEEFLKRRTMRTIRGIEEVLLENITLNNAVNDVICLSKEYSPLVGDDSNTFYLQEGQLSIRVETME